MGLDSGDERQCVRPVECGSFEIAFFKTFAPDILQQAPVVTVGSLKDRQIFGNGWRFGGRELDRFSARAQRARRPVQPAKAQVACPREVRQEA